MKKLLLSKFKNKKFIVGIVGLGYVGLPICERFSRVGVEVIGVDNNSSKINTLKKGSSYIKSSKLKNFNYFITYTRVEKNPEYGFVGRLDKKKLSKMIKDFKTPYYFSCGSLGFIKSVKDILLKQGANKEKIEVEGY